MFDLGYVPPRATFALVPVYTGVVKAAVVEDDSFRIMNV
jgi:hypothetical protein